MSNSIILSGILVSPLNEPISNAKITFTSKKTDIVLFGIFDTSKTDKEGNYTIKLNFGVYSISVYHKDKAHHYGEVTIDENTTEKTLNDLIIKSQIESEVTPEIIIEFREIQKEINEALGEVRTGVEHVNKVAQQVEQFTSAAEAKANEASESALSAIAAAEKTAIDVQQTKKNADKASELIANIENMPISSIEEASKDGFPYARKDGKWYKLLDAEVQGPVMKTYSSKQVDGEFSFVLDKEFMSSLPEGITVFELTSWPTEAKLVFYVPGGKYNPETYRYDQIWNKYVFTYGSRFEIEIINRHIRDFGDFIDITIDGVLINPNGGGLSYHPFYFRYEDTPWQGISSSMGFRGHSLVNDTKIFELQGQVPAPTVGDTSFFGVSDFVSEDVIQKAIHRYGDGISATSSDSGKTYIDITYQLAKLILRKKNGKLEVYTHIPSVEDAHQYPIGVPALSYPGLHTERVYPTKSNRSSKSPFILPFTIIKKHELFDNLLIKMANSAAAIGAITIEHDLQFYGLSYELLYKDGTPFDLNKELQKLVDMDIKDGDEVESYFIVPNVSMSTSASISFESNWWVSVDNDVELPFVLDS